jgi:prepilin signal peptidase PulO-like enzyme (type II secretory pathway)
MDLIFSIFAFALGLIIGSFLNCLIWRLYKNETITGRSYCPKCRKQIAWYDNIPVISFMILGGKCRHCQKKISWQYPLVETITAILFLLTFSVDSALPQFSWLLVRDWLLIITLVIVFVYDFRWQLVPMSIVWPMSFVFLALNIILGFPILTLILSGLGAAIFFLLQYLITKKRGLGEGDIWLGLMLGLALPGFQQLFLILILAYCLGSIVGIFLMLVKNKDGKTKVALGPFLAFGAIITLIWGEKIINWYFHLFY